MINVYIPQIGSPEYCFTDCFEEGSYGGAGEWIDIVDNINDATGCQEECQKHLECEFWSYHRNLRKCWRQTVNDAQTLGTCGVCTRGPRNCEGK